MPVTLQLKNSTIKGKAPDPAGLEYGELCVNAHSESPAIYFKDNAGGIIKIGPGANVPEGNSPPGSGNQIGDLYWDSTSGFLLVWNGAAWVVAGVENLNDLKDVNTDGVVDGMVLAYDSGTWTAVSAASIAIDVDLGYTPAADKGTVTNTAGDDAVIPLANGTNAGLSLNNYTTAEKDKLAGIEDGAEANVGTDLGYTPAADKGTVTSSTGDDAEIPLANGTNAGLSLNNYTTAEKDKLGGIENGAIASVDLGYTPAPDKGTVTNDAGTDAEIPLANGTNAGLTLNNFTTAEKDKLDGYPDDPANLPAPDLQAVTDAGATTTNQIESANDQGYAFTHLANKLALQSQNLSANYAIRFPPAPADADKRFLAAVGTNTSGNMDLDWVAGDFDPTVLNDYLKLSGGHMNGGVSSVVGTVPDGAGYELNAHNFWDVGAITVANPITVNLENGQSGLFLLRAAPIGWGTFYKFKGGTPPAPTSFPAVCPFYVNSSGGETYVGPAIEVVS